MRLFTHLHITGLLSFCICMFISLNANVSANNFTKESFNLFELTQINVQNDSTEEDLLNDFFLSKYLRFFDREYRESPAGSMYFQERGGLQGEIPFYSNPDSVYKARLGGLSKNCVVKLPFNDKVRNYIDVYVNKRRKQVNVMLALSQYYFPIFEDALLTNGVPTELKYLAIIESALNPKAMSRMGASGLWQFMYQTGRMYDLKITTKVDERYDPVKASNAAARYLKDLYNSFGDWTLAIAAYNCGPGNVNKAIRKAKGKTDFWEIYPFLPKETRGYVPAFIGATYVMNYYKEHGFYPPQNSMPILTDTLMV
ncbi:MAG: lytic transglycosylase domain-containing protein, partial [Bacteroidales bacterium]